MHRQLLGFFCASIFHFYVNDSTGPIGSALRGYFPLADAIGLDDLSFGMCFVSLFMQITGILQMPVFLGPSWSPFYAATFTVPVTTKLSRVHSEVLEEPGELDTPKSKTKKKKKKKA